MIEVPATAVTDPSWLSAQLSLSSRRYPLGDQATLGVLWWYSASTVLLGPFVDGKDPSLEAITLLLETDGRVLDARSRAFTGSPASSVREMLIAAISSVAKVSGARSRQLWAITTDSLANRLLWAGRTSSAVEVAAEIGPELPQPRYVEVNGRQFVRRVSCCLIYQGTTTTKCTSCPRQTPGARLERLKAII
ncbi:hypothetical protein JOF56_004138 [Kibdelosporangium banguiense]|uniref:FhuF 2Fe-2S C-terminal domain-containing protein n=1 Tax=Kibdelosporangium banguiense TaxID=1365924 RepID=A0ABS4TIP3_9PSEU|nr:(2Fe-2S)-binding protein [Kibdelosporangium banguiense]MBP2323753.1 hypothetical protein [Kibdelosporangium banguiense]